MNSASPQGGFNTERANCWSRHSRKQRRPKDRGWLPGSSAQSVISLPLTDSGGYVGRAGLHAGRRHQQITMHATTPVDTRDSRHEQPPFQLDSARRCLRTPMYNVHYNVQCTLVDAHRQFLRGCLFKYNRVDAATTAATAGVLCT